MVLGERGRVQRDTDLVVLRLPLVRVRRVLKPLLVLGDGEEVDLLVPLRDTDDGRDELDQELGHLQQGRVEVVEVVQNKTLDMRTIVILGRASV